MEERGEGLGTGRCVFIAEPHVRKGERPYSCEVVGCGYTATQRGTLRTHMRTHTQERPFECEVAGCGFTTLHPGHLQRHARSHTDNGKVLACGEPGCGFIAAGKRALQAHKSMHAVSEQEANFAAEAEQLRAALEADREKRMAHNRKLDSREGDGANSSESCSVHAVVGDKELQSFESAVEVVEKGVAFEGAAKALAVLGLGGVEASAEAVRKRWLLLSRLLHPDKVRRVCKIESSVKRAEDAFKACAAAYKALTAPE